MSSFDEAALGSDGLVILDFYTSDCAPCKKLEPMLAATARTVGERLKVVRVDAAEDVPVVERYGVQGVPTLVLLAGGAEVDRRIGFSTAQQLRKWVEPYLD